jgi:hypothetical protein
MASGFFDTVANAASSAWDTASSWVSGPPAETGPITVPVTPEQEQEASDHNAYVDQQNVRAQQDKCYEQRDGQYDYDPANPYENYCD